MTIEIPEVPTELEASIRSLAQAAYLFRGVFVQVAEGRAISQILSERQEAVMLTERVLDAWWSHLRLDAEELENGRDR